MSRIDSESERFINDFVLRDRRIEDHPNIRASVGWLTNQGTISCSESFPPGVPASEIDSKKSMAGLALTHRDAIAAWDLSRTESDYFTSPLLPSVGSILVVPMLGSAEPRGVLNLYGIGKGAISQEDVGRAQLLAAILEYIRFRPRTPRSPQSIALGQALRSVREELRLTQDELARRAGTGRINLSQWENGRWPVSGGPLYRWCRALGLTLPGHRALVSVVDATPALVTLLREDPNRLVRLSPQEFERFVAGRMDQMGFDVTLTGNTSQRDGGIDLIAVPKIRTVGSFLLAGQIKHHSTGAKVGRADVDRLLAWKDSAFRIGLLVTNTAFTKDARWAAAQNANQAFLRLRDFDDLKRWIEDDFYSKDDWDEIPERITLAPGVTVEIPKATVRDSVAIWPLSVRTHR